MKFYQRLDWQLAFSIVVIFILLISFTGLLRKVSVQILIYEVSFADRQQVVKAESIFAGHSQLGADLQQKMNVLKQYGDVQQYIYIFTSSDLAVLADSTDQTALVELVRQEPKNKMYTVVVSSSYDKRELFIIYQNVPALELEGNLLLVVPNPVDKTPIDTMTFITYNLELHLRNFGLYYLGTMVFIVLFLRWRLRPLRVLEQHTQDLSLNRLPNSLKASPFEDEVGALVNSFNAAIERLKSEDENRTRMLADISHELRTPLNNLLGRLEAQHKGIIQDKDRVLAFSYHQVQHLVKIVEDIELLTAMEYGDLSLNLRSTKLLMLLEEECQLADHHHHFSWQIKGEECVVSIDELRIRQVIKNLLQNAVVAMPDKLTINMACSVEKKNIVITVIDNGPGVAPEQLEKIFERLYRVDTSRNLQTGGSGLGLSIVRRLLTLHGGSINAFLPDSRGLGFKIVLPI